MSNFDDLESEFLDAVEDELMDGKLVPASAPAISDAERQKQQSILRSRSETGLKQKWAESARESIDADITPPPIISEPKCHACQSDHRLWIERQLVKGTAYVAIARSLPIPEDQVENMRRSISNHFRKHMALEQASVRALMEEEAQLLGQNVEEGVRGAFSNRAALDILIRKAFEDALNGVTTVEPKDLIQMMKLHADMSTESGSTATEEAKTAIRIFMLAIQNVLLKSDLVDREHGQEILVAINSEVVQLREEESIDMEMERHLIPRRTSSVD
jgi:hypothetical protein